MEKKHRLTQTRFENVKDRGDSRKDTSTEAREMNTNDLGDTTQKPQQKPQKPKENKPQLTKEEIKKLEVFERLAIPKKLTDFSDRFENQIRTYLDVEGRKRLRERYTVKLNKNPGLMKNEAVPEKIIESDKEENKIEEPIQSPVKSEPKIEAKIDKIEKPRPPQRKPIIKTFTVKNDNRVYKAVTFIDNKTTMPLQIKIPTIKRNHKNEHSKSTEVSFPVKKASKVSLKEKPVKKERRFNRKRISSPEILKSNFSPPTEVAKWAPSCLTGHTKPYYEAWVDTTLAAISKRSQEETEKLIRTFQRDEIDDLFYENFKDERYTGRIKVRQSEKSQPKKPVFRS